MGKISLKYDRDSSWEDVRADVGVALDGPDALTSVTIDGMRPEMDGDLSNLFAECTCLKTVSIDGAGKGVSNISGMFGGCIHLQEADVAWLDTKDVTRMDEVFLNCKWLKEIDLSGWDVRNVRSMDEMFLMCSSLERVNLSGWRPAKLRTATLMFGECPSLKEIVADENTMRSLSRAGAVLPHGCRVSKPKYRVIADGDMTWSEMRRKVRRFAQHGLFEVTVDFVDTSKARSMNGLFEKCRYLRSVDLSGLDTYCIEDMGQAFAGCASLADVNLSMLDTSHVRDMSGMFWLCGNLVELDLSVWDVSRVRDMYRMFAGCVSLKKLDLSGWQPDSLRDAWYMFQGCENLEEVVASEELIDTLERAGAVVPEGCRIVEPAPRTSARDER